MPVARRVRIATVEEILESGPLDQRLVARALARLGDFRAVPATPSEVSGRWTPKSWATGIYVLDTGDGLAYVGKSVDLRTRLNAHRKTWPTLRAVCFTPTRRSELDAAERAIARDLQQRGVRLWNKTLIDVLTVPTPLDERFPKASHERWLDSASWNDWSGQRLVDPDQRHRYQGACDSFALQPEFSPLVAGFRALLGATVPAPIKTESTYWSISCYKPTKNGPFIRLNIGHQATLDGFRSDSGNDVTFRLWIPQVMAEETLGAIFKTDARGNQRVMLSAVNVRAAFEESALVAAGPDQIILDIDGAEEFSRVLACEPFILAMRRLHLGLMQRGKNLNKRSHCLALADVLLPHDSPGKSTTENREAPSTLEVPARPRSPAREEVRSQVSSPRPRAYSAMEQRVLKCMPSGAARIAAVERLELSIKLATELAPMAWGLSVLKQGFLRLNVGMIEVATVHPDGVRLLVVHHKIPSACEADSRVSVHRASPDPNRGVYPSVSQSAVVAVPYEHPQFRELVSSVLADAHRGLIQRAATTRPNPMTAKAHQPEAVALVRELARESRV